MSDSSFLSWLGGRTTDERLGKENINKYGIGGWAVLGSDSVTQKPDEVPGPAPTPVDPNAPRAMQLDISQMMFSDLEGADKVLSPDQTYRYATLLQRTLTGGTLSEPDEFEFSLLDRQLRAFRGSQVNLERIYDELGNIQNPTDQDLYLAQRAVEDYKVYANTVYEASSGTLDYRPEAVTASMFRGFRSGFSNSLIARFSSNLQAPVRNLGEDVLAAGLRNNSQDPAVHAALANGFNSELATNNAYLVSLQDSPPGTVEDLVSMASMLLPDLPAFAGLGRMFEGMLGVQRIENIRKAGKLARTAYAAARSGFEFGTQAALVNADRLIDGNISPETALKETELSLVTGLAIGGKSALITEVPALSALDDLITKRSALAAAVTHGIVDTAIMSSVELAHGHEIPTDQNGDIRWGYLAGQALFFGALQYTERYKRSLVYKQFGTPAEQVQNLKRDVAAEMLHRALFGRGTNEVGGIDPASYEGIHRKQIFQELGFDISHNGALVVVDPSKANRVVDVFKTHVESFLTKFKDNPEQQRGHTAPESIVQEISNVLGIDYTSLNTKEGRERVVQQLALDSSKLEANELVINTYHELIRNTTRSAIEEGIDPSQINSFNSALALDMFNEAHGLADGFDVSPETRAAMHNIINLRGNYIQAQGEYVTLLGKIGKASELVNQFRQRPLPNEALEPMLAKLEDIAVRLTEEGTEVDQATVANARELAMAIAGEFDSGQLGVVPAAEDRTVLRAIANKYPDTLGKLSTEQLVSAWLLANRAGMTFPRYYGEMIDETRFILDKFPAEVGKLYNEAMNAHFRLMRQTSADGVESKEAQVANIRAWEDFAQSMLRSIAYEYMDSVIPQLTYNPVDAKTVTDNIMRSLNQAWTAMPEHHPLRVGMMHLTEGQRQSVLKRTTTILKGEYERVLRGIRIRGGELLTAESKEELARISLELAEVDNAFRQQFLATQRDKSIVGKEKFKLLHKLVGEYKRHVARVREKLGQSRSGQALGILQITHALATSPTPETQQRNLARIRSALGLDGKNNEATWTRMVNEARDTAKIIPKPDKQPTEETRPEVVDVPLVDRDLRNRAQNVQYEFANGTSESDVKRQSGVTTKIINLAKQATSNTLIKLAKVGESKGVISQAAYLRAYEIAAGIPKNKGVYSSTQEPGHADRGVGLEIEQRAFGMRYALPEGPITREEGRQYAEFLDGQARRLVTEPEMLNANWFAVLSVLSPEQGRKLGEAVLKNPNSFDLLMAALNQGDLSKAINTLVKHTGVDRDTLTRTLEHVPRVVDKMHEMSKANADSRSMLIEAAKLANNGTHVADLARFLSFIGVKHMIEVPHSVGKVMSKAGWDLLTTNADRDGVVSRTVATAYFELASALRSEAHAESYYLTPAHLSVDLRHHGEKGYADIDALVTNAASQIGFTAKSIALAHIKSVVDNVAGVPEKDVNKNITRLTTAIDMYEQVGGVIRELPGVLRESIVKAVFSLAEGNKTASVGSAVKRIVDKVIPDSPAAPQMRFVLGKLANLWVKQVTTKNEGQAQKTREIITDAAGVEVIPTPNHPTWSHELRTKEGTFIVLRDGNDVIPKPNELPQTPVTAEEVVATRQQTHDAAVRDDLNKVHQAIQEEFIPGKATQDEINKYVEQQNQGIAVREVNLLRDTGVRLATEYGIGKGLDPEYVGTVVTGVTKLHDGKVFDIRLADGRQHMIMGGPEQVTKFLQSKNVQDLFNRMRGQRGSVKPSVLYAVTGWSAVLGAHFLFGVQPIVWIAAGTLTAAQAIRAFQRVRVNDPHLVEIRKLPAFRDALVTVKETSLRNMAKIVRAFNKPSYEYVRTTKGEVNQLALKAWDTVNKSYSALVRELREGIGKSKHGDYNVSVDGLVSRLRSEFGWHSSYVMYKGAGLLLGEQGSKMHSITLANVLLNYVPGLILAKGIPVYGKDGSRTFKPWFDASPEELVRATDDYYTLLKNSDFHRRWYDARYMTTPNEAELSLALSGLSLSQKKVLSDLAMYLRHSRALELMHGIKQGRKAYPVEAKSVDDIVRKHEIAFEITSPTVAAYISSLTYDALRAEGDAGIDILRQNAIGVNPHEIESTLSQMALDVANETAITNKVSFLRDKILDTFKLDADTFSQQIAQLSEALMVFATHTMDTPSSVITSKVPEKMFSAWLIERQRQVRVNTDFVSAFTQYVPNVMRKVYTEEPVQDAMVLFNQAFLTDPERLSGAKAWLSEITRNPGLLDHMERYAGSALNRAGYYIAQLGYYHTLLASPKQFVLDMSTLVTGQQGHAHNMWHQAKAANVLFNDTQGVGRFFYELVKRENIMQQVIPAWESGGGLLQFFEYAYGGKNDSVDAQNNAEQRAKYFDLLKFFDEYYQENKGNLRRASGRTIKAALSKTREFLDFVSFAEVANHLFLFTQQVHTHTYEALLAQGGKRVVVKDERTGTNKTLVQLPDGSTVDPFDAFMTSYVGKYGQVTSDGQITARKPLVDVDGVVRMARYDTDTTLGLFSGVNLSWAERKLRRIPLIGQPVTMFTNWQWNYLNRMGSDIHKVLFAKSGSVSPEEVQLAKTRLRRRILMTTAIGGVSSYHMLINLTLPFLRGLLSATLDDDSINNYIPKGLDDPRFQKFAQDVDEFLGMEHVLVSPAMSVVNKLTGLPVADIGRRIAIEAPILSRWRTARAGDTGIPIFGAMHDTFVDVYTLLRGDVGTTQETTAEYTDAVVRLFGSTLGKKYLDARGIKYEKLSGAVIPQTNPLVPIALWNLSVFLNERSGREQNIPPQTALNMMRETTQPTFGESFVKAFVGNLARANYGPYSNASIRWRRTESRMSQQIKGLYAESLVQNFGSAKYFETLKNLNDQAWKDLPHFVVGEDGRKRLATPADYADNYFGITGMHPLFHESDVFDMVTNRIREKSMTLPERNIANAPTYMKYNEYAQAVDILAKNGHVQVGVSKDNRKVPMMKPGTTLIDLANSSDRETQQAARVLLMLSQTDMQERIYRKRVNGSSEDGGTQ